MTSGRRWSVVAVGVALLIAIPLAVRAIPAADSDITAATLLARIESSRTAPFSGYAESVGTVELPITDRFTDVGELLGERTRMRVWWDSADRWRVDRLLTAGEVDTYHRPGRVITWDYERSTVTRSADPAVRLPRATDLLPPQVAYRLLDEARPEEISRLPSARVAGQSAAGLRLVPSDQRSSVSHVDVWADEETGVPLRVEVYGDGDATASVRTEFMSFSDGVPDANLLVVPYPPDAYHRRDGVIDIVDATNQFAEIAAPQSLLGLERSTAEPLQRVGVYGYGVTRLVAIPLWGEAAVPLRRQLGLTPGSRLAAGGGVLLDVGPLHILLTGSYGGGWLLAGTVTDRTLIEAAAIVPSPLIEER